MQRSILCLLLALSLAGCAPAAPPSSASASISPPAATLEEPSLSLPQTADVPPGSYAPWQESYAEFLVNLRAAEYQFQLGETAFPGDDMPSDSYSLYDVDKDGVPELFLKCGTCEADYYTQVYTFRDGKMAQLDSFQSGHSSLYSCPGENAVLLHCAHMGHGEIDKFSLTDGAIGPWETFLTENGVESSDRYTYPDAVVPGSQLIPTYYTCTQFRPLESSALALPIYDYHGRELPTPMEEAEVRSIIGKVLYENAPFFGVSGDGFHGDTGPVTLAAYLQAGAAYPYGKQPLELKKTAWADVNGDGRTDCLLWLEQEEEKWTNAFCAVLSAEEEEVYAYFFDSVQDVTVEPNGTVTFQITENHWTRASFFKNQSYTFPTSAPTGADGLAWDSFTGVL